MIGDDDVDTEVDGAANRLDAGDPAINRDDQPDIALGENALQHFELQPVAVDETMRNDVRCVGAEKAEDGLEEDDGGDAVDVVIAVDQDRFFVSNSALDSLARRGDSVNARGIVQICDRRSNEAARVILRGDTATDKNVANK